MAGRWPERGGALPVWSSVESPAFRARFGALAARLPLAPGGELAPLLDAARRAKEPPEAPLALADRGGTPRPFTVAAYYNRRCHFVLVAERPARRRRLRRAA